MFTNISGSCITVTVEEKLEGVEAKRRRLESDVDQEDEDMAEPSKKEPVTTATDGNTESGNIKSGD